MVVLDRAPLAFLRADERALFCGVTVFYFPPAIPLSAVWASLDKESP